MPLLPHTICFAALYLWRVMVDRLYHLSRHVVFSFFRSASRIASSKPDGYSIPAQNLTGLGMSTGFYPQVQVQNSTHTLYGGGRVFALPALNLTHYYLYLRLG
jgi:hypothetical protein